jgi:hypothetical protein
MMTTALTVGTAFKRANDRLWDYKLAVHTRGLTKISLPGSEDCVTLPYSDIMFILGSAGLRETDVFVDIGCGRGRVLCCASLFPVRKVVGIEHDADASRAAKDNAAHLRGALAPIHVIHSNATEYEFSEGTVFYMYNPFKSDILEVVLERICESLSRFNRPVRIIYANPVHDVCLSASGWLKRSKRLEAGGHQGLAVPVSFWEST